MSHNFTLLRQLLESHGFIEGEDYEFADKVIVIRPLPKIEIDIESIIEKQERLIRNTGKGKRSRFPRINRNV